MGQNVSFPSNGGTCDGYFAAADGPGVLVIQEWWGLVPHIHDVVDRFAAAGFTALAPDLYHGATTTEPDDAGKLMMAMNMAQAAKDMSGAIDFLREQTGRDQRRRHRVLHGRRAGARDRHPAAGRGGRRRSVLRAHPVARRPARLVGADRQACAATTPSTTSSFTPSWPTSWSSSCATSARTPRSRSTPASHHAFFNDTRPEVYDAEASEAAWDATLDLFRDAL